MHLNFKTTCGIIAAIIGIGCFIPYVRDTFLRKTKPHIYTWLIWTILQVTGVIAMYNNNAGIGALALAIGALLCAFTFLLCFKYGSKNITLFDTFCLIGALAATLIYFFLHNPLFSIILVSVIDFTGFLPTLRKAYHKPYSETLAMYVFFAVSSLFSVLALSSYSAITLIYPLTLTTANFVGSAMIWWRRRTT